MFKIQHFHLNNQVFATKECRVFFAFFIVPRSMSIKIHKNGRKYAFLPCKRLRKKTGKKCIQTARQERSCLEYQITNMKTTKSPPVGKKAIKKRKTRYC